MQRPAAEQGFSLVEIILTIVIISIALTAAIAGWGTIARHSADVMWQSKVAYLGQAYINEILAMRYDENTAIGGSPRCDDPSGSACSATLGPDSGETSQELFDDVDDYNGLTVNGGLGLYNQLVSSGAGDASYNNYSVSIEVTYVGADTGYLDDANSAKQITVTVTPPENTGQGPVSFSAIRGNY